MAYKIYRLVAEDFTGLGGLMGTEKTTEIFSKNFSLLLEAKRQAEADFKQRLKGRKPSWDIKWTKSGKTTFSGDLGFIGYYIYEELVH